MAVAHEELMGKTWLLPAIADAVGSRTASHFGPPPSQPGRTSAVPIRRGDRPLSADEFHLPGYALCSPSAQTPPPELKRGKGLQSDRSGPKYAKVI
jgi:hypothetical protein